MSLFFRVPELSLAVLGFAVNAVWEFAQTPLYSDAHRGAGYLVWSRLHCAAGDALILLGAFWITAAGFGGRRWWATDRWAPLAFFLALGLGYTAYSEWYATTVSGAWTYAPQMPVVLGIGLTPMLQWLALPPLIVKLMKFDARRKRRVAAS